MCLIMAEKYVWCHAVCFGYVRGSGVTTEIINVLSKRHSDPASTITRARIQLHGIQPSFILLITSLIFIQQIDICLFFFFGVILKFKQNIFQVWIIV